MPFATISCFSFKNTDANNVGTRRPSVFLPEDFPRVVSKLQKSGDARRKSLLMSNKERNVIQILTVISVMFAVCNIPQVAVEHTSSWMGHHSFTNHGETSTLHFRESQ